MRPGSLHRFAGPGGLRHALRWRRTVRWAYAGLSTGERRFSDPYEQIIDNLVRQWAGDYRVWDVFSAPTAERADLLEVCHTWRMVRGEGLAWRLERRDFPTGQWAQTTALGWGFASFALWPFSRIREPSRANGVRRALVGCLVDSARSHVRARLGLWNRRCLGRHNGEMVLHIRLRHWARTTGGLLRNARLEPAMRVFVGTLWRQALAKPLAGGLAAVHGMAGYSSQHLWPHLIHPQHLLAWEARPNLRPLLSTMPPAFWPDPGHAHSLAHDCVDAGQRSAVLAAPARLLAAADKLPRERFAYWCLGERVRRRLEDLSLPERMALVRWCAGARGQGMPLPLMESLILTHRDHLLRGVDAGAGAARCADQARDGVGPLERAGEAIAARARPGQPIGVCPATPANWPAVGTWHRWIGPNHPWNARRRERQLARALGAGNDLAPRAGRL